MAHADISIGARHTSWPETPFAAILCVSGKSVHLPKFHVLAHIVLHSITTIILLQFNIPDRSDSVVECLTRDLGAAGSSHTGVTVLCP